MSNIEDQAESAPPTLVAAATAHSVPDARRWRAPVLIAVAQLMIVLDATIVNIALPTTSRTTT